MRDFLGRESGQGMILLPGRGIRWHMVRARLFGKDLPPGMWISY
ncbi:hypothetical protein SXCC_03238 [Gluconacetobacter sp. SXCC-1]|nr:hypothetical protein SXCC_03238 [Gluconacetobacter sp. SXCC-1]